MIKSSLKKTIPFVQELVPPALPRMLTGRFVPVFLMHRFEHPDRQIRGASIADLRKCLEYFRRKKYIALSLQDLALALANGREVPENAAVFTVDDGFIDQYEIGASLFAEYDIPLTLFLITGFIDGNLWPWDDQIAYIFDLARAGEYNIKSHDEELKVSLKNTDSRREQLSSIWNFIKSSPNDKLYDDLEAMYRTFNVEQPDKVPQKYVPMTWDNAHKLVENGHCVGPHSLSHRILSRLNDANSLEEITGSIEAIRTRMGFEPKVFAYPTGRREDFTTREIDYLAETSILASVSTIPGSTMMNSVSKRYSHSLPRYSMPDNLLDFRQYLSWVEVIKDKFRSKARESLQL